MSFFSTDDWSRLATFESDAVSPTGFEASNLASERVNARWRVTDLEEGSTRFTLDVTLDEARASNYLFLQRPRSSLKTERANGAGFIDTDTIRVVFYSDVIGGDVVEDTGDVASAMLLGVGSWGLWRPNGVTFAAMRIEFDAVSRGTAPDNFVDFGRLAFGPAEQFTVDYIGLTESLRSKSSAQRPSLGASFYKRGGAYWRIWSILFRCILESERESVREFMLANATADQFVFGFDETRPFDSWMLAAMLNPDLTHASRNFKRLPMELEEAL